MVNILDKEINETLLSIQFNEYQSNINTALIKHLELLLEMKREYITKNYNLHQRDCGKQGGEVIEIATGDIVHFKGTSTSFLITSFNIKNNYASKMFPNVNNIIQTIDITGTEFTEVSR